MIPDIPAIGSAFHHRPIVFLCIYCNHSIAFYIQHGFGISIVLLHFIQRRRTEFDSLTELICAACASRFRSIFLVGLTSIAGFAPMLFETSEQAKFLVPATLSLTASLSFGMIATLILVPVSYAILVDIQTLLGRQRSIKRRLS